MTTIEAASLWNVTTRTARTRLKKMLVASLIRRVATSLKDPFAVLYLFTTLNYLRRALSPLRGEGRVRGDKWPIFCHIALYPPSSPCRDLLPPAGEGSPSLLSSRISIMLNRYDYI
jgi:hypothetical protein